MPTPATLDALRHRIRLLERPAARDESVLAFGVRAIDEHLPERGLPQAALHEVAGGGADAVHGAAAALFTAGLCARLGGTVLWCTAAHDLFAPGLACAGLHPDRVIHAAAPDEQTVLLVMEEALRHPGLSAVVGEVARLPMTASRRLVLAAEKSGVMSLVLRRRPEGREDTGMNAACTRWRVTPLPSSPLPVPGLGRARWRVELARCRGGAEKTWDMEACDAQGRLSLPAEFSDRQAAPRRLAG